jgi:integrase
MSKPTIEPFTTPGGKKRFLLKWFFRGDLHRKRFDSRAEANRYVTDQKQDADELADVIRSASEAEQADMVTALMVARENRFTLAEAANAYAIRPTVVKSITMEKAAERFLASRRTKGARPKTLKTYGDALAYFRATVGKDDPNDVSRSDMEEFLGNPDWAPTTRNYYFRHIRAFFNWMDGEHIAGNPCEKIESSMVDAAPPTIMSVEQAESLMAAAREHDRSTVAYLALGLFAGIRPEGIPRLQWSNIDMRGGTITVPVEASKTRHDYDVKIEPNLATWLKLIRRLPLTPPNLRHRLDYIRAKAEVEWAADIMRHSFGSYHLDRFQDPKKTAWEMGHSGETRTLFKHYRKLVKRGEGKRFFKISA